MPEGSLDAVVFHSPIAARASVGELPEAAVWAHLADRFQLSADQLKEFRRDFWIGDRLDTVLVEFLRATRRKMKTAILSNAWSGARKVFEQDFGLGEVVDAMIISAEEGIAKPDARIYHLAAERLGVHPAEAVFVDDFAENVHGAVAVGMQAVWFRDTAQALAEVRELTGD